MYWIIYQSFYRFALLTIFFIELWSSNKYTSFYKFSKAILKNYSRAYTLLLYHWCLRLLFCKHRYNTGQMKVINCIWSYINHSIASLKRLLLFLIELRISNKCATFYKFSKSILKIYSRAYTLLLYHWRLRLLFLYYGIILVTLENKWK